MIDLSRAVMFGRRLTRRHEASTPQCDWDVRIVIYALGIMIAVVVAIEAHNRKLIVH
jgi:hypothetical protein